LAKASYILSFYNRTKRANAIQTFRPSFNTVRSLINFEFGISITNWEGKFKLSQDKNPCDIENARAELIRFNQDSIKSFLDKVF